MVVDFREEMRKNILNIEDKELKKNLLNICDKYRQNLLDNH